MSSIEFKRYIQKYDTVQSERDLTVNELKDAFFFLLKTNKSSGCDRIDFNVIKTCFGPLIKPLMHFINSSLAAGIFPGDLKIAQVTPVFIAGDDKELENYRPISVLPYFSKTLERIMYNRVLSYLTANEILYKKQFGFQKGHSTKHAIMQSTEQINKF